MAAQKKMLRSFKNYLDSVSALDYQDLQECIQSDIVWDDGRTRRNPSSYELFATHEHLDFAKEDIFKSSGVVLDLESFELSANKVAEIWKRRLPLLFPGYEFIIDRDNEHKQVAFCRKRTGITQDPDEILTYLKHNNHNIRWNALLAASLYPDPRLVPALIEGLNDDDTYNVLKAIIALGHCGDETVAGILRKRFLKLEEGPDGKLCINDFFAYDLFRTLVKLGDKGYKPVFDLFKKYNTLDINTVEHLCEVLGKTGKDEVLKVILSIYFNEPEAYESALTGLLSMEKKALPYIITYIKDDNPDRRKKAMWFVANCYTKTTRKYLAEGLKDNDSSVREAAVHGIGRFYHRSRKTLLLEALKDRSNNVRNRAIEALGSLLDPKLIPVFENLCLDKNPKVRNEAMRAVASFDSRRAVKFLSELYDRSSKADKLRIIDSLYAFTGNPAYLKPLISKALQSDNKRIMREINDLLEMM